MILLYYAIKECTESWHESYEFSLIHRTETAKYLLSGVIRDRLVVLLFQLSDVK